jgi:hypothetical protein
METAVSGIFGEKDGGLTVIVPYLEVYLPGAYFTDEVARWVGEKVVTLCIFEFSAFASEGGKAGPRRLMALPLELTLGFSSHREEGTGEDKMVVLQLRRGDVLFETLEVARNAESTKSFIKLLHGGHLPLSLPYDQVIRTYMDSLEINGVDLGVPSVILEAIVSEIYRSAKDLTIPYRKVAYTKSPYKAVNLKRLGMLNSTFAAISFEDMGQAVVSSVGRSRRGIKDAESPVERSIKY